MGAEAADRDTLREAAIDDLLAVLDHERRGDAWVGRIPERFGPMVFGGVTLATTIGAACRDAPAGSRLHSLHVHFLRAVQAASEVELRTEVVKAGRAFHLLRIDATQAGKAVVTATCSFTSDTDGDVYDLSGIPADVPLPDDLPADDGWDGEVGPWDGRWLGPSELRPDGTREATHRHWFRLPRPLADDPHLHTALLGYATDWTGSGGRPLDLDGQVAGLMVSLDHAAWFHRPARADEWLLQDVQSLVNAGGRGTLRGVIRTADGRIVASLAQEMLLRSSAG